MIRNRMKNGITLEEIENPNLEVVALVPHSQNPAKNVTSSRTNSRRPAAVPTICWPAKIKHTAVEAIRALRTQYLLLHAGRTPTTSLMITGAAPGSRQVLYLRQPSRGNGAIGQTRPAYRYRYAQRLS